MLGLGLLDFEFAVNFVTPAPQLVTRFEGFLGLGSSVLVEGVDSTSDSTLGASSP